MALTIKSFFNEENIIREIDIKRYDRLDAYTNMAEAFSRNFCIPVFIVDFHRQNFLYASSSSAYLRGITGESDEVLGKNLYFDFLPQDEEEMLKEIIGKSFELFHSFPVEERSDWTLSYYFHLCNGGKKRLIMHKITPLELADGGRVWLALCTFAISSRKEAGYPTMRRNKHQDYFFYSLKNRVWYYREGIDLSNMEREILLLSSQGFTMKEIARRVCRSEDSIKASKRVLFAKLGVKNITEAAFAAMNDGLYD